jgi:two-component system chemotaxis response regulator CheB
MEFMRPESMKTEIEFAKMDRDITDMSSLGKLSPFTCVPRGALGTTRRRHSQYRCHTGHAFSKDSLLVEQTNGIEDALYSALRAVEEKATALRRLGERSAGRSDAMMTDYQNRARELDGTAEVLRQVLASKES